MKQYFDTLQDLNGNAIVGPAGSIIVKNYPAATLASIYSDNGLTPIANSAVTADSTGQVQFFAADGDYIIECYKNALLYKTLTPFSLFDGAAQVTVTATGSPNAYAVAGSQLEKALRTGLRCFFLANFTNTGLATFQYNGLTVKNLIDTNGNQVAASTIVSGTIYGVEYNGTAWQVLTWTITAGSIGQILYPRTTAENAALVTPTNFTIASHDALGFIRPQRYGLSTAASASTNTAALTSAKSVASQLGGAICRPGPGTFAIADFTCDVSNFLIEGDGENTTVWSCDGVTAIGMLFSKGASSIVRAGVRLCGFSKSDSNTKTAVKFQDQRQCFFDHIGINQGNWPGTAAVGLELLGRDFLDSFDCDIECARPVLIEPNPNSVIDLDMTVFRNWQFNTTVSTGACVELANGVTFTFLEFDNCDFAGGKNRVVQNDTTATVVNALISFKQCRWEQSADATGFDVSLQSTVKAYQKVSFNDCEFDPAGNGVFLRNAERVSFDTCQYGGVLVGLDMTFISTSHLSITNCLWQAASTATLTNARLIRGSPKNPNTGALPPDAVYDSSANAELTATTEVPFCGLKVTIAQDASAIIGTTGLQGMLMLTTDENISAIYALRGSNATTAVVSVSDAGFFTNTAGTASSWNVFATGGNYVVQNKRTGSHNVRYVLLGASPL